MLQVYRFFGSFVNRKTKELALRIRLSRVCVIFPLDIDAGIAKTDRTCPQNKPSCCSCFPQR